MGDDGVTLIRAARSHRNRLETGNRGTGDAHDPSRVVDTAVPDAFLAAERRAGAADDVAGGTAELNVDDTVQDEVDGEIDEKQIVDDDRRRLVGVIHLLGALRTLRTGLQHVLTEEIQQSRRSTSSNPVIPGPTSTFPVRGVPLTLPAVQRVRHRL